MMNRARCILSLLAAFAVALGVPQGALAAEPTEIQVYAAASLRDVLQEMAPAVERATGTRLVFNLGASNDLARQIVAANKADIFFSADEGWMDRVAEAGLVDPGSRRSPLSNRLVVVVPLESALVIASAEDLVSPAVRRLSLANPDAVPAGKYAKAWLESKGQWAAVAERVIPALDVRAALAAVESGAVEAGVVYRTDAAISKRVRVAYVVPESEGPRVSYAIAALQPRPNLEVARAVVAWICGQDGAPYFERSGFIVRAPAP
jgi:molybdate transport system substrate-binding protein